MADRIAVTAARNPVALTHKEAEGLAAKPRDAGVARSAGAGAADAVELSGLASAGLPAALSQDPPFDVAEVSRIREALGRGDYPLDLDQLADRLWSSYTELAG